MSQGKSVLVVGGGLAGMSAALALAEHGLSVRLLESKRNLGGRAASFRDAETEQTIDYCQHVSLGCCTNLSDFCQRTNLADCFERISTLHFLGPKGEHCLLKANHSLPAPLHLLPALWGLKYLSIKDRVQIARCLGRLGKLKGSDPAMSQFTMQQWLVQQHQSEAARAGFWEVILVSALGEKLDRVSVAAARKVFVDGFMAAAEAYEMLVPKIPLGELYGERLLNQLAEKGVDVQAGKQIRKIERSNEGCFQVQTSDESEQVADIVVLATPWRQTRGLLSAELNAQLPDLQGLDELDSSPITGIHLWVDQPITDLPHAVLVNRFSQWLFRPAFAKTESDSQEKDLYYFQVVISASHELAEMTKEEIIARVLRDLQELFLQAKNANVARYKVVTERHAVFSPQPGTEKLRPAQKTSVPNLFLAGDWTKTDWPATMEGAVRGGYLAAESVLESLGQNQRIVINDLPRGRLARWVIR